MQAVLEQDSRCQGQDCAIPAPDCDEESGHEAAGMRPRAGGRGTIDRRRHDRRRREVQLTGAGRGESAGPDGNEVDPVADEHHLLALHDDDGSTTARRERAPGMGARHGRRSEREPTLFVGDETDAQMGVGNQVPEQCRLPELDQRLQRRPRSLERERRRGVARTQLLEHEGLG